jgi:hypothetical protein
LSRFLITSSFRFQRLVQRRSLFINQLINLLNSAPCDSDTATIFTSTIACFAFATILFLLLSFFSLSPHTHTRHTRSPSLKPTTHVRPCSFQRQRSTDRPTRRLSLLKSASQPCINLPDDTDYTLVWYLAVQYLNHPRTSTSLVQVLGLFVVVSPVPVQFYHRPPFPFQTSACLPPLSLPLPPLPPPLSLSPSINPLSFCPPFCASFLLDSIILRSS